MTVAAPSLLQPIDHFKGARDATRPKDRQENVRQAARAFRKEMLAKAPVSAYHSVDLVRVPYPTKYALRDACSLPMPYIHILNRMFVVQFEADGAIKTLLVSPSNVEANRETPFFKRLSDGMGSLRSVIEPVFAPQLSTVPQALQRLGIAPEQVDYITYDHLHTQDVREWLGAHEAPGFFPNAQLLVMRQEWESAQGLVPPHTDWYCPGGIDGIPEEKVLLLDGDTMLGESVALIFTPGHTEGNHSIVAHTPEGLFVTSENGVCADSYAPQHSQIPGLRRYAESTGMEVVLNGNTLERGVDQVISMIQEKEIAGPSPRDERFPNMACSSELTAYWMFPGIKPTFSLGEVAFGDLKKA